MSHNCQQNKLKTVKTAISHLRITLVLVKAFIIVMHEYHNKQVSVDLLCECDKHTTQPNDAKIAQIIHF